MNESQTFHQHEKKSRIKNMAKGIAGRLEVLPREFFRKQMVRELSLWFILFCSIFIFTILNQAKANSAKCEEGKRDADIFLREVNGSCGNLHQCLVRRDTCLRQGKPTDQEKCEQLDQCMLANKSEFPDYNSCRYEWKVVENVGQCNHKKVSFISSWTCPGRIWTGMGVVGLILAQGDMIDYSVDGQFNCDAHNKYHLSHIKSLDRAKEKIKKFCPNGASLASLIIPQVCAYSKNFKPKSDGTYSLENEKAHKSVGDGNRGSGEDDDDDEGGGEESGGGGKPK